MSNPNPRKRAAPGATPVVPMQPQMQQPYPAASLPADQMVRWNGSDNMGGFVDGSANPGNSFDLVQSQPQYPQNITTPSNSLASRPVNRALIPTTMHASFDPSGSWFIGDDNSLMPQQNEENGGGGGGDDNIEELEERAQKAKREAQGKRKQIPPFVQKLSSFLEEGKNEDLIRWSEKGDSFVVLDEDEFAKTLIPELFKHNNYASFVRQLNMYGFHKRVGLSDNSMRASERKNKSPSEYSNPYFRRGHPNLLWLINKPKSGGKGKKTNKNDEAESDEDAAHEDGHGQGQGPSHAHAPKSLPPAGDSNLPRKDVALIRDELKQVRDQQKLISRTIAHLQQNNRDLYNQAMLFQSQHDRHQNSINAILHFLANLFRKSLEEQGNSQSVGDILTSMLASQGQQTTQQGNVVDLGEFFQNSTDANGGGLGGTPHRRARGLLPPIPDTVDSSRSTRSPSAGQSGYRPVGSREHEMGQVTELFDGSNADTPPNLRQELENNPQEQMMRIINDHNATNSSGMDLPEAADFVANAPNKLNLDQRNQLANFMNRQSTTPGRGRGSSTPKPQPSMANPAPPTAHKNPSVSPSPGASGDHNAAPSMSPIMRSPAMPPLSMSQISTNQSELERLQELQSQQDARINELNDMLGPLSPSGRIPGIDESGGGDTYFDPQNVDLDQYFNDNAFLDDASFGGTGPEFNVNFDAPNTAFDTGQVPGVNTTVNGGEPSPTGTEEIQRDDFGGDEDSIQSKRRRMA